MATTVAQMTTEELRAMIGGVIEEKFREILGDPDARLPMKKAFEQRLLRQKRAVARGVRGESLDDVVRHLGLD